MRLSSWLVALVAVLAIFVDIPKHQFSFDRSLGVIIGRHRLLESPIIITILKELHHRFGSQAVT